MADLKIPNLNKKNDKYLFKNKFSSKRKTKRKLLIESFYMLILSILLASLNFLIPNKSLLFINLCYVVFIINLLMPFFPYLHLNYIK